MFHAGIKRSILRYSTGSKTGFSPGFVDINTIEDALRTNKTLARLMKSHSNGALQVVSDSQPDDSSNINSDKTLPMTKFLKDEIFAKIENDKMQQWKKPFVKWLKLGVYMMKYYRDGVKNTYLIHKRTKPIYMEYEKQSKTSLITQMFRRIEFYEIQQRYSKSSNKSLSLPITRKQYVEYFRRNQIWKLPVVVITLILLEEFTAALFYFFPKIAPHNCLTPGGFLKVTKSHSRPSWVKDMQKYQSPYTLSTGRLISFLKSSPVAEIPVWRLKLYEKLGNREIPCEKLVRIHQYIFVDDWLLLQQSLNGSIKKISYKELVNCIWERQLYSCDEDLNGMVNDEVGRRVLLWRLFVYWSFRFDGTITVGDEKLYSEKWGVNNVSILGFSGMKNNKLITGADLMKFDDGMVSKAAPKSEC